MVKEELLHEDINLEDDVSQEELAIFKNSKKEDKDSLFRDENGDITTSNSNINIEAEDIIQEFDALEAELETDERKEERRNTISQALNQINNDKKADKDPVILILRGISLIITVGITGVLATYAYINYKNANQGIVHLDNTNNENILVTNNNEIDISSLVGVRKISINGNYSTFYMRNLENYDNYYASLVDDLGNYYSLNSHYSELFGQRGKNMLAFEPFKNTVKEFTIYIRDLDTSKVLLETVFVLNEEITELNSDKYIKSQETSDLIQLEYGDFTNETTILGYSLKSNIEENVHYNVEDNLIYLQSGKKYIPPKSNNAYNYNFDDFISLENAFANVEESTENLTISFENIVKTIDIKKTINGQELVKNQIKIELPSYNIVLEGFKRSKNQAVLVYYIEDKNDYTSGKFKRRINDEYPERSNGGIEITLSINKDGQTTVLEPVENRHKEIGGDIRFEDEILRNMEYSDLNINLGSVEIEEPLYTINFNKDSTNIQVEQALKNIKEALRIRCEYVAGINILDNIPYFTEDILYNEELMEIYTPIQDTNAVFFDSNIVSFAQEDGKIYALVNEKGQYSQDENANYFNINHEIIYDLSNDTIIQDKIIKVDTGN